MYFRVILSAAGLAGALTMAPGQAEVLTVDSTFAINGMVTIGDPPILTGDIDVAGGPPRGDFEVQSAPIVPVDTFDLNPGTPAGGVVPEPSTWAMLFGGLGVLVISLRLSRTRAGFNL